MVLDGHPQAQIKLNSSFIVVSLKFMNDEVVAAFSCVTTTTGPAAGVDRGVLALDQRGAN